MFNFNLKYGYIVNILMKTVVFITYLLLIHFLHAFIMDVYGRYIPIDFVVMRYSIVKLFGDPLGTLRLGQHVVLTVFLLTGEPPVNATLSLCIFYACALHVHNRNQNTIPARKATCRIYPTKSFVLRSLRFINSFTYLRSWTFDNQLFSTHVHFT